jgi:tetratricopeptide (TPR) repeat protein
MSVACRLHFLQSADRIVTITNGFTFPTRGFLLIRTVQTGGCPHLLLILLAGAVLLCPVSPAWSAGEAVTQESPLPLGEPPPGEADPGGVLGQTPGAQGRLQRPSTASPEVRAAQEGPDTPETFPGPLQVSPSDETEPGTDIREPVPPSGEASYGSTSSHPVRRKAPVRKDSWTQGRTAGAGPGEPAIGLSEKWTESLSGPFGMRAPRYRYPEELLQRPWDECKRALKTASFSELKSAMNRLYEARLDTGFPDAPGMAALLVREANRLLEAKDVEAAKIIGQSANDLAPGFFPVSLFLSRLAFEEDPKGWANALSWRWISLKQRWSLFSWQVRFVGKTFLLFLLASGITFLFFGPYFVVRYGPLFFHATQERVRPGWAGRCQIVLLFFLCATVLWLLPGWLWGVVIVGMLLGRFMRRWERALFTCGLGWLALSPLVVPQAVRFLSLLPETSRVLCECTQGDWDATCDRDMEKASRSYPDSEDLLLTRALVEKRRGNYAGAAKILEHALERFPDRGPIWNNVGNLRAFEGNLEGAKDAYIRSIRCDRSLSAPHYNLSQLLRREFSFIEGGRAFQEARRIDPGRVDYFAYIHSQNPNRFFMDEGPSRASCWRYALARDGDQTKTAEDLWSLAGSGMAMAWAPWIFGLLTVVFLVQTGSRRERQKPVFCTGCGVIVCDKCQAGIAVTRMCTQCYQALYTGKDIPRERRNQQIRKMARRRTGRVRKLVLLNLVLPGLGFSVHEDRISGFLCWFLFLFFSLAAMFWNRLLPLPVVVWETGGATAGAEILGGLLIFYLVVQLRFFWKLRSGR